MTTAELRKLTPGTRVLWDEPRAIGIVRRADNGGEPPRKPAMWIEWEDGQRTEDYDDWALVHVSIAPDLGLAHATIGANCGDAR